MQLFYINLLCITLKKVIKNIINISSILHYAKNCISIILNMSFEKHTYKEEQKNERKQKRNL